MSTSSFEPTDSSPETAQTDGEETPVVEFTPELIRDLQAQLEAERLRASDFETRLRQISSKYTELNNDYAGFKKRQEQLLKDREELLKGDAVKRLFEPLQNLIRSVEAMKKANLSEEMAHGLDMVRQDFMKGFHDLGLEEVPGVGSPFSTHYHEALMEMAVSVPEMDGKVIQVHSAGYRVGTRLIREAKVVVGKYTPSEAPQEA